MKRQGVDDVMPNRPHDTSAWRNGADARSEQERIVASSPTVLYRCVWDVDAGQFVGSFVSDKIFDVLGYRPEECMSPGWWLDGLHPDDREAALASQSRLVDDKEIENVYRLRHKSGEWRWILDTVRYIPDDQGRPFELIGNWVDISDLRRADLDMQEREKRLRLVMENMPSGYALHEIICDEAGRPIDYRYIDVNPAFGELTGIDISTLPGRTVREVLPGIEQEWIDRFGKVALSGEPLRYRNYAAPLDRTYDTWAFSPRPGQFAVMFVDISEQEKAREALEESRILMQSILSTVPECIFLKDMQGRYTFCNESVEKLFGLSRDEIIGHTDLELIGPQLAAEFQVQDDKALAGDQPQFYEERVPAADGREVLLQTIKTAVRDDAGEVVGLLGVARDITAQRKVEEAMSEQHRRYEQVVQSSMDGFILLGEHGEFIDVNPAYCRMLGYERETLLGMNIADVQAQFSPEQCLKKIDETRRMGGDHFETRHRRKDGMVLDLDVSSFVMPDSSGYAPMAVFVRDVTQSRRLQAAAMDSARRYRLLVESAHAIPWTLDLVSGRFTYVGEQIEEMLGVGPETMCDMGSWAALILAEDRDAAVAFCEAEVARGRNHEFEYRMRAADGRVVWVRDIVSIVREQGRAVGLTGFMFDITAMKQAELAMKASEQRYRNLVEMMPDAVAVHQDGRIVYDNPACAAMFGYASPDAMLGADIMRHVHPDYRDLVKKRAATVYSGEAWMEPAVEEQMLRLDGSAFWVEVSASRVEHDGRPASQVVVRDITARKAAEMELEQSRASYQQLVNNLKEVVFQCDMDGSWSFLNPAWEELTGFAVDDTLGKKFLDFVWPEDVGLNIERSRPLFAREKPFCRHEIRYRHKDGGYRWVEVFVRLTLDADGRTTGAAGTLNDITERKANEQEAAHSVERLQRVLDADFDAIVVEQDGGVVFANQRAREMFGYASLQDTLGRDPFDYVHPTFRRFAERVARRSLRSGKPSKRAEILAVRPETGDIIPVEIAVTPIVWRQRPALVAMARDISDRKLAEQELKDSEAKYRTLFDDAHDLIHITDAEGRITDVNRAECERLGYSRQEMLGRQVLDFIHPDHLESFRRFIGGVVGGCAVSEGYETRFLTRGGDEVWVEVSASPQLDAGGRVLAIRAILHDVTERVLARRDLQQALESMRAIGRNLSGIVFQFGVREDGEWYFPFLSESVQRFFGITAEEGMQDAGKVFGRVFPEDARSFQAAVQQAVDGLESFAWQGRFVGADGEIVWLSCSSEPQQLQDGSTVWNGVAVDESAQHRLEEQFRQAQKMEAVGTLVGGIAHDFNNMLAGMMGQLYLMRHTLAHAGEHDGVDAEAMVKRILSVERQGQMAADVIAQLMTFARKGQVRMQQLDVNRLIADALHLHRVSIPESIEIRVHLGDALEVEGDAGMIQQMLLNLMTNARDALVEQETPRIELSLSRFEPDAVFLAQYEGFTAKPYACLEVRDNGCGMRREQIERIFDPFYTTKEVGKGTGLGLAMLYGAMQTHRGHVLVESRPGEGSVFRLYFPLLAAAERAGDVDERHTLRGQGQTILLADDEQVLIEVIGQSLQLLGYHVLTAHDGEEAVRMFGEHREDIALAILDVVMPKMGGVQAAGEMRRLAPELPIVFHTGYGEEADLAAVEGWEDCTLVKKPVNIELLSRVLAGMLPAD